MLPTITRRDWFARMVTTATATVLGTSYVVAQSETPTLKEQLEFGLKARRPEEFAFIEIVVTMVDNGQLPRKLVTVSFNWARDGNREYPYQYFVRALRILAARQGIDIPPSG